MLIRQKEGVEYALNCAGPAYHAINDVTYTSEHKQFASFRGSDGKTFYGMYGEVLNFQTSRMLL